MIRVVSLILASLLVAAPAYAGVRTDESQAPRVPYGMELSASTGQIPALRLALHSRDESQAPVRPDESQAPVREDDSNAP